MNIRLLAIAIAVATLPFGADAIARSDGQIHRDANGWLKKNNAFTGASCVISKGRHVLTYMSAGVIKITARNFDGIQNLECVATYPSEVFYMR